MKIPVRLIFELSFLVTLFSVVIAQNPQWKVYTNGNIITALAEESSFLWVGTTGGLVRLDKTTGEGTFYNNANSGLTSNYIQDVAVDGSGTKWILADWLTRFDGTTWTILDTATAALSRPYIRRLSVDKNKVLWALFAYGTIEAGIWTPCLGLTRFDGNDWTYFQAPDSLARRIEGAASLAIDKSGVAWIGTRSGLLKFDGTSWKLFNESNSGLRDNHISCIVVDDSNCVWIGSTGWDGGSNGGLTNFDGMNWTTYSMLESGIDTRGMNCIVTDTNGNKWIGGYAGLAKFDGAKWTLYDTSNSDIPYDGIGALLCDDDGDLWVGTGGNVESIYDIPIGKGLAKFDGSIWTKFNTSNSGLPFNTVTCIAIDGSGTKWIGANTTPPSGSTPIWGFSGTLVKLTGTQWTQLHNTQSINVSCHTDIDIANTGNIWVAAPGNGLLMYDGTGWVMYNQSNSELKDNAVTSVVVDSRNTVWASYSSSLPGGLARFDGSHWTTYNSGDSGLPTDYIDCLAVDWNDVIWAGTFRGLVKFDGSHWVVYTAGNSGLPSDGISSLAIDGAGNLWIATGNHLVKFDSANWVSYDIPNFGPEYNWVKALAIDAGGIVWLATYYSGLATFDGARWTSYTTSNSGLPNGIVNCIAFDPLGNTWIGTDNGLAVFKKGGIVESVQPAGPAASFPTRFALAQNYPNPFNPSTAISYQLPAVSYVTLKVFDLLGREVATLVKETKYAGSYTVNWDASRLSSGVYFYRLTAGNFSDTRKLILLR